MPYILHIPEEEYHARQEWSNSQVKMLPSQPELFFQQHVEKSEPQPKAGKAAELGSALHGVILEGKEPPIIPREVLNAQGHRKGQAWKNYAAEHPGPLLTEAEARPLVKMIESVRSTPGAMELLDNDNAVYSEVSLFTKHSSGLDLRCRLDRVVESSRGIIVPDLKTTLVNPHSRFSWSKVVYDRAYHRQGAWYKEAAEELIGHVYRWCWVVVQNEPPYSCKVWELAPLAMEMGHDENEEALEELAYRLDKQAWHPRDYGKAGVIDLPPYAYTGHAARQPFMIEQGEDNEQ